MKRQEGKAEKRRRILALVMALAMVAGMFLLVSWEKGKRPASGGRKGVSSTRKF